MTIKIAIGFGATTRGKNIRNIISETISSPGKSDEIPREINA